MKIIIEKEDLERLAEDIRHNASMLELSEKDEAAEEISFYVPVIQEDAAMLKRMADTAETWRAVDG